MKPIISVEGISKSYAIGQKMSYGSLREEITDAVTAPFRRLFSGGKRAEENIIWALKDVSFDVNEGEVLGIIGRNGAGKSTLLKILSRITEPTEGRITMRGRIASLLEVGTGFHPELTGRENIFLNGSLLGMSNREIKAKFDEIVAFSEIEKFLDTPVKRYSSGMYVRLAFAVAAHLEPEILVVDEVLAVGDTIFQKKCLDRMMEIGRAGKTVLFVSHNLSAVKALCSKAVLFKQGRMIECGGVQQIVDVYLNEQQLSGKEIDLGSVNRNEKTAGELVFAKISFCDYPVRFAKNISFKLKLRSLKSKRFEDMDFGVAIKDKNNNTLVHCSNRFLNADLAHDSDNDEYQFEIENNLKPGLYSLTLFLRTGDKIQDWLTNAVRIEIEDGNPYNFHDTAQIQGVVLPFFDIKKVSTDALSS